MQNDNSNFKEATRIYAEYTCCISIDIDDMCDSLGIKKEDIKRVNVKWNTMYILMDNGDTLDYCIDHEMAYPNESIDWKWPNSLYLLKAPFNDLSTVDNPFKDTDTDTDTDTDN